MTRKINVLDHGFARLVDSMGSDLAISAGVDFEAVTMRDDMRAGIRHGTWETPGPIIMRIE